MSERKFVYSKLANTWEENKPHNDGGFILQWGIENFGFGEFAFVKNGDKVECYTECMDKETIKEAVLYFLENEVEYIDK